MTGDIKVNFSGYTPFLGLESRPQGHHASQLICSHISQALPLWTVLVCIKEGYFVL